MLTLKIKSKGQMVEIPGSAPFRTPATIDISKMKIRDLIGYLRAAGIENYEIVATSDKGVTEVYKKDDFELPKKDKNLSQKAIEKRFNKLEKLIGRILEKQDSQNLNKEQNIDDKLNKIEMLLEKVSKKEVIYTKNTDGKDPEVEDDEPSFIPSVDITDMKLKASSVKSIEQDQDNIDDAADSLSEFLGGKK